MKASFFKRLGAFLIDYLLVSLIFSIITVGFSTDKSLEKAASELINSYVNEEISISEYNEEAQKLNFDLQKQNVPVNTVSVVLFIGYFIVFAYLNKGQTVGKKLFKIRVVKNDNAPSLGAMIIRSLFIYGIISGIYNIIFVNFLNVEYFSYGSTILSYIESLFIMVSFFMVLYKKDGKGLHDIMARTNVIEEVK